MKLNNVEVKNYGKPYIIAEIGANHNGDIELAKKMILSAKNCGADAVKFQSWSTTSLIAKEEYERNQSYNDSKKKHFGSLFEMVDKYQLTDTMHKELADYCNEIDVEFCSTPFSIEEVDLLEKLNVSFYKVASMDINNLRLIRYIARKGKPVILSTGMSNLTEIEKAINVIKSENNNDIILLHCVSIYPPKNEDINLNNILMLKDTFKCVSGFSDHTIGTIIPIAAMALGASVVEKHFTLDKDLPGWDHAISANPEELREICEASNQVYLSLGNYNRTVSSAEEQKKKSFRRSMVATRKLLKGQILSEDDVTYKRPGTGISPELEMHYLGRTLSKDIEEDALISVDDFL